MPWLRKRKNAGRNKSGKKPPDAIFDSRVIFCRTVKFQSFPASGELTAVPKQPGTGHFMSKSATVAGPHRSIKKQPEQRKNRNRITGTVPVPDRQMPPERTADRFIWWIFQPICRCGRNNRSYCRWWWIFQPICRCCRNNKSYCLILWISTSYHHQSVVSCLW